MQSGVCYTVLIHMAHQSLYRAYRPASFKEVLGQEEVIGPLTEQLAAKKLGHAYLFAGSRGLGKTSVARIFARELGCDERDVYEIDAASHNGVDYIRELSENVYTLPFASPCKVYILDEAHMLSKSSWNAFLKTLEEPPAHAIFILATTELDKVPETVRSRCQVFTFKKPSRVGLAKLVAMVAKKEGYALEASAADLVALLADGSYRDALSVLEKVLSVSQDKKLTREEVSKATGAPKAESVHAFVTGLAHGKADVALAAVTQAAGDGLDMNLYLSLVIDAVRQVLLVRFAPELRKEIAAELGADAYADIEALAKAAETKLSHNTLRVLLEAAARARYTPVPSLPLELAVFELVPN